jgi:hypothetical protein
MIEVGAIGLINVDSGKNNGLTTLQPACGKTFLSLFSAIIFKPLQDLI